MASHLSVRAFSTASSTLLKLKRHRHYNNQPHELARRISSFGFTPSFLRPISNANRYRSAASSVTNPDPDIPVSESDSDSEYDSDYVSPSWAKITGIYRTEWLVGSNVRYIPCSNRFMRAGNRGCYQLEIGKESIKVAFDMPGIDKEGVKVFFYDDELHVRAVESRPHEGEVARVYATGVTFLADETHLMKVNDADAEMKDGVLRVVIPKTTLERRKRVTFFPVK